MRFRICAALALLLLAAGCQKRPDGSAAPTDEQSQAPSKVYALIVKSIENPYMATMYDGFRAGCEELGIVPVLAGPGASGTPSQVDVILDLMERNVDAIAIASNDMDEVSPMLQKAKQCGIPVVSLDSMVKPEDRIVHIQQASPEMIGRVLIQACAQIIDGEGEFAILTTTDSMPNQARWVALMLQELSDHPEQYEKMKLVEIAYGLDEAAPSAAEAVRLLETYPNLKIIIAPTVVGMRAAAEQIKRLGSAVLVTGLGLPSEMEKYITSGICPWMYLWNPAEVGYLAAHTVDALVRGEIHGDPGEILSAGTLGKKVVTQSEDGGIEIVLGYPKVFDMTNIAAWGELF